jgi:hypothetical protein
MKIGNIDNFMLGVAMARKLNHWRKMANNSYLPRRRKYPKADKFLVKG